MNHFMFLLACAKSRVEERLDLIRLHVQMPSVVHAMDTCLLAHRYQSIFYISTFFSSFPVLKTMDDRDAPFVGLPLDMVGDTFEITVRLISGEAIRCRGHYQFAMSYLVSDIDKQLGLNCKDWDLVIHGKRMHFRSWRSMGEYGLCGDIDVGLVVLGDLSDGRPRQPFEHYAPPDSPR